MRIAPVVFATLLCAVSCTVEDATPLRAEQVTTTTDAGTSEAPEGAADADGSVGVLTLDGTHMELDFDCYAPGAGEVLATGALTNEATGERIEVYVQAFLGSPYLGISRTLPNEETRLLEPALGPDIAIAYDFDVIRLTDVGLITDLELETGDGTPAGVASLVVECRSYSESLPEGFATG